jgi:hypothetical protein
MVMPWARVAAFVVLVAPGLSSGDTSAPGFGRPENGLSLGIEVLDAQHARIAVVVKNVTDHPIALLSHVATNEKHYDWYQIRIAWPLARTVHVLGREGAPGKKICGGRGERIVPLYGARDKSAPVKVTLGAGEQLRHEIDVASWAARSGALDADGLLTDTRPLGGGWYELSVTYSVAGKKGVWNGTISSVPVRIARTGPRAYDMCDSGWSAP